MLSDYIKQCIAYRWKENYWAGRYSWIYYFSVVQRVRDGKCWEEVKKYAGEGEKVICI